MSSTYLSASLNVYKHTRSNNCCPCPYLLRIGHFSSVGVKEVGISFPLLSALFAGLLLQHTLHASVCFASCNCPDLSVLVAGKSRSRTKVLVLILKKKKNNGTYSATFTVVILHKAENIHYLCMILIEQLAIVHWFNVNMSINYTYQEPPTQV